MVGTMQSSFLLKREAMAKAPPHEVGSTQRVRKLNSRLHSTPHTICLRRAHSYTKVFRETEGEPTVIRFARAYARTLEELPAYIEEGEMLVGGPNCRLRSAPVYPEIYAWLRRDVDTLSTRAADRFEVTPQQVAEIKEITAYWQGKTIFDRWSKACPPELLSKVRETGWGDVTSAQSHGYHFTPPFEVILAEGISSYEQRVRDASAGLDNNLAQIGKRHFYEALLITTAAIKNFAVKYSRKALELADKETDPKRQKELVRISQSLERVPFYGARSFFEAIQAVHFIMVLMHIEGTGPYVMGRIDQYLYPFYKADLDRGLLTPQEAQELIELLFIKLTAIIRLWSNQGTMVSPGYKPTQTITLGGVDSGEKDASNELTFLFLNAAEAVRAIQPDIALLCHPRETPYALMLRAAEMNALGLGIPKFFNTEVIKTMLVDAGYTVEEATVGWIRGCTGIAGPGCKQQGYSSGAYLNPAMALETVLFNGRKRTPGKPGSGQLLGVATGDPRQFASFDDLMKALKIQLAAQIKDGHVASCLVQQVRAEDFPLPLESLFTDACIERGLTPAAGGAKINVGPGIGITGGIATVADSLAAIKKLVFEEKKLTMGELLNAVDANFEGYEPVRQMLLNQVPKFGNDDDYVDDLARAIWQFASSEAKKHVTHLGNPNKCGTYSPMSNSFEGKKTWATPDGRKAGVPLSNHYGPTDGLDISGPAANINSVTKLGIDRQAGAIHNLYLVNVNSEDDFHRIVDLVELFFHRGGSHLQLNCQDKEVFVDAQKHPERYPGLMVRVAGYVAFFVELPEEIQDQIIGRTSHYV